MNEVYNTFNEVDELRGRLASIMVNYPDTEVRMRSTLELLDTVLTQPTHEAVQLAIGDLTELRGYFIDISKEVPDLRRPLESSIELIERLLGPNEETRH